MQKRLPLATPARKITRSTVISNLHDVPLHREPPTNLTIIFLRHSPSPVVATVPLEPPTRICRMYPSFLLPNRERLARIHSKEIERRIVSFVTEFCMLEPIRRKFVAAIRHVLAAEDTEREHLLRSEFGLEASIEVTAFSFCEGVSAVLLHEIVDTHDDRFYSFTAHN